MLLLRKGFAYRKQIGMHKRCLPSRNWWCILTKTYLYNIDPLKPHFYIVKLWFRGYILFFVFLLKNIGCGYSLEPPRLASKKYEKISVFLSENFQFLEVKFSIYLNRHVFVVSVQLKKPDSGTWTSDWKHTQFTEMKTAHLFRIEICTKQKLDIWNTIHYKTISSCLYQRRDTRPR